MNHHNIERENKVPVKKRYSHRGRLRMLPEGNGAAELVECERFHTKLTEAACITRFDLSKRTFGKAGAAGIKQSCKGCHACPQGEERSGG